MCTDIGIWIFVLLLVLNLAYQIYLEVRFEVRLKAKQDRLFNLLEKIEQEEI